MIKGGYSLGGVASRSAARSGDIGIDRRLSAGGDAFWLLGWRGLEKLGGGLEPLVTSIGLTEGKKGRSTRPRKRAWSRVGDFGNDNVVFAALRHRGGCVA